MSGERPEQQSGQDVAYTPRELRGRIHEIANVLQRIETKTTLDIALINNNTDYIKRDVADIKEKLDKDYVTRSEFAPVKMLVYGLAGTILTGFIGALMYLVLK